MSHLVSGMNEFRSGTLPVPPDLFPHGLHLPILFSNSAQARCCSTKTNLLYHRRLQDLALKLKMSARTNVNIHDRRQRLDAITNLRNSIFLLLSLLLLLRTHQTYSSLHNSCTYTPTSLPCSRFFPSSPPFPPIIPSHLASENRIETSIKTTR
jgi:hypothetical protein